MFGLGCLIAGIWTGMFISFFITKPLYDKEK